MGKRRLFVSALNVPQFIITVRKHGNSGFPHSNKFLHSIQLDVLNALAVNNIRMKAVITSF